MQILKIALLTDGIYPFVLGGMQKHSFYLAKYLAKAKVYVDVYHYTPSQQYQYLDYFDKEELTYLNFFEIEYPQKYSFPFHYLYERYFYSKKLLHVLEQRLSEYDFIYCKGFSGWALISRKLTLDAVPPIGLNFHGYEMFQQWPSIKTGFQLQLLKIPVRYLTKRADIVFSYGGRITDVIISNIGIKSNKILEIPSGISRNWLVQPDDVKTPAIILRFVFVGRFERRKGIEELRRVILSLLPLYNFEFHFIGPIPENQRIIHTSVKYHGIINNEKQLQTLLRKMDILVCPSHSEGMPNVILEGMASGLAIIATDVGATNLLIQHNGWLLDAKSLISNLLQAMKEAIVKNNEDLLKMKLASINIVQTNYLWDKIIDRTINEIRRVI